MTFLVPGQRVVLASSNPGKLNEINDMLSRLDLSIVLQGDLNILPVDELGSTFVENSLLKAKHAAHSSGMAAIADDSGLEVFALDGAPGVHSSRYAGPNATDDENNEKLLRALAECPEKDRSARFHCVITVLRHANDPTPLICHGYWDGNILEAPRGENGFGYDPLFFVAEHQCTSAELSPKTKNRVSHRARAFEQMLEKLHSV